MQLQRFNRDLLVAAIALAAAFSGISWLLWDAGIALGIALTTPVSVLWIRSTASTVHDLVFDPKLREADAAPSGGAALKLLAKLPLVALALTLILWYMPARPEGVAIGVLNGLLAAIYAAIRQKQAPPSPPPAPQP